MYIWPFNYIFYIVLDIYVFNVVLDIYVFNVVLDIYVFNSKEIFELIIVC